MTPREIDPLVAEHVMGWKYKVDGAGSWFTSPCGLGIMSKYIKESRNLPHYSTNIADAWLVVEKFGCASIAYDKSRTTVVIGDDYCAYADTPAKAICLAALKAKGVEVKCR